MGAATDSASAWLRLDFHQRELELVWAPAFSHARRDSMHPPRRVLSLFDPEELAELLVFLLGRVLRFLLLSLFELPQCTANIEQGAFDLVYDLSRLCRALDAVQLSLA